MIPFRKVLITGANGFLGHHLCRQLKEKGVTVIATGMGPSRLPFEHDKHFIYETMDCTDTDRVKEVLLLHRPDAIIHAAAISKPDECELDKEKAFMNNVNGTMHLLQAASVYYPYFLYVSTDFVFDGEKGMYTEEDIPNPVNYYGQTKWEAEKSVQAYKGRFSITRTVLVYGKPLSGKDNILTIVQKKLLAGEKYRVVSDQFRTPTYVEDLATGIILMLENKATGIYHLSGEEVMTPYDMALAVAKYLQLDASLLEEVNASVFSQPAKRPPKTGFRIDKAKKELGFSPIPFSEGLKKTFA